MRSNVKFKLQSPSGQDIFCRIRCKVKFNIKIYRHQNKIKFNIKIYPNHFSVYVYDYVLEFTFNFVMYYIGWRIINVMIYLMNNIFLSDFI